MMRFTPMAWRARKRTQAWRMIHLSLTSDRSEANKAETTHAKTNGIPAVQDHGYTERCPGAVFVDLSLRTDRPNVA